MCYSIRMKVRKPNQQLRKKIRLTTLQLRKKWAKNGWSSYAINTGRCADFALDLVDLIPQGKAIWGENIKHKFPKHIDGGGHCFFVCQGRYYDSEAPQGVEKPHLLKYYKRT